MHLNTHFYCHFVVSFTLRLRWCDQATWIDILLLLFLSLFVCDGNGNGSGVHFIPHYPSWYCQLNIIITITSLNSTWLLNLYYSFWLNGSAVVCAWCVSCICVCVFLCEEGIEHARTHSLSPSSIRYSFCFFIYSDNFQSFSFIGYVK